MKKLVSILLAVCMVAALVPVLASAEGAAAKFALVTNAGDSATTTYELTEGMTKYFVTDDGAAHPETASESNYTIKLDYPAGGKPTIYLKGATLQSPKTPLIVTGTAGVEDFVLVVEEDSVIESGASAAIRATSTNLTFTGEGKLTINAKKGYGIWGYNPAATDENKQTIHSLIFEDANVEVNADNSEGGWGVAIGGTIKNITVDGGNVVINTVGKVAGMYSMNGDLLITGGANVEVNVEDQVGLSAFTSIVQESGHLQIRTAGTGAPGISGCKDIRIVGGTVDIKGPAVAYGTINLDEYEGEYTAVVCQSKDGKGAVPYDYEKHNLGYFYTFQLTKGASYEVTVKNGTSDKSVVNSGDTVTITARIAPAGKAFDKWEVNNGTITLADPSASTTTFTTPSEDVKVTALYKDVEEENNNDTGDNDTGDNETDNNAGNDTNNNAGNDTNNNAGNDTNNNAGNDTNNNAGNDTNTNTETPNNQNTENTTNNGEAPAKKDGSGITTLLLVLIIVVSVGIGAAGVILFIKLKAKKPETEEAEEAPAEDAE